MPKNKIFRLSKNQLQHRHKPQDLAVIRKTIQQRSPHPTLYNTEQQTPAATQYLPPAVDENLPLIFVPYALASSPKNVPRWLWLILPLLLMGVCNAETPIIPRRATDRDGTRLKKLEIPLPVEPAAAAASLQALLNSMQPANSAPHRQKISPEQEKSIQSK